MHVLNSQLKWLTMFRRNRFHWFVVAFAVMLGFSCEQYEYASPTPGILEVRFAVRNEVNAGYIPFGDLDSTTGAQNLFAMVLNRLEVKQSGDVKQEIFSSLSAIRRNPDGDIFNCLHVSARDSMPLLGIAYVPPGHYTELVLSASLNGPIIVSNPPVFNEFPISALPPFVGSFTLPINVDVQESRTTKVVVTLDLDLSLIRRAEDYVYREVYYVSSVQQF